MENLLKYDRLFVYSEKNNQYRDISFSSGINIIYGRNTSGKSTLIQLILYAFGINDVKTPLTEILEEEIIVRLDCTLIQNNKKQPLTLIRDNENLFIKFNDLPTKTFFGIKSDHSAEHIKLKNFFHILFNFNLKLEQNKQYLPASIETIFLPYYISQATGWVYLRKSFSNLEFFKNFKYDYLDYYLGLTNNLDRLKKYELEKRKDFLTTELSTYKEMNDKEEYKLSKILDEKFMTKAESYIKKYQEKQAELIQSEKQYVFYCNELSYMRNRISVLNRVKKNHKNQNPDNCFCPVCNNSLKNTLENIYIYHQDSNDTNTEIIKTKENIKDIQGKINSLSKSINKIKNVISKDYELIEKYKQHKTTFESWLEQKSNLKMSEKINSKIVKLQEEYEEIIAKLKEFRDEDDIDKLRNEKDLSFSKSFQKLLNDLKINSPLMSNFKYKTLYKTSAFPLQGVELHKTVLAHNFAFINMIKETNSIHRLPFMIDAIFKEDIDDESKEEILTFISTHQPLDIQLLVSIAHSKNGNSELIENYNKTIFNNKSNLICIGDSSEQRAFLENYNENIEEYLNETFEIMENA